MGLLQLIQEIRARFAAGDLTLVDVIRYTNQLTGYILSLIDGTPTPFGSSQDETELVVNELVQLYEEVVGDPPPVMAVEGAMLWQLLSPLAMKIAARLLEKLLEQQQ